MVVIEFWCLISLKGVSSSRENNESEKFQRNIAMHHENFIIEKKLNKFKGENIV
jgi:hypothetical protein